MMEQIQQAQGIPHLVQVYQPSVSSTIHISHPALPTSQGKVTYHQSTSETLPLQVSSHHVTEIQTQIQISQNQIVMSCQQGLQSLQPLPSQTQVLGADLSQSLQIASHVLLPQHMLVNGVPSYYNQYEYPKEQYNVTNKEHHLLAKLEPELQLVEREPECDVDSDSSHVKSKKRSRSQTSNPTSWACNVRKLKHQQGEAYVSKRGKYVPERQIKTTKDCLKSCKYKCSEKISEQDRESIFKAFYSLNFNEKRFFILNSTERVYIKRNLTDTKKRKYSFKYFFLLKSDRLTVCKKFYLGTLAISQKPIYNVHMRKSDTNIPKPDGRGQNKASTHSLPLEVKDNVRKHIYTFKTIDCKPLVRHSKKIQYLDPNLSIKQMYNMYYSNCKTDKTEPVKESMYRKIVKNEFNLCFQRIKTDSQLCTKCKGNIKKK